MIFTYNKREINNKSILGIIILIPLIFLFSKDLIFVINFLPYETRLLLLGQISFLMIIYLWDALTKIKFYKEGA